MSATIIHETREYTERYDPQADREHGPDNDLETYYSPDNSQQICLTNGEREDFERAESMELTTDVLTDFDFSRLLVYVQENCEVQTS